MACGAPVIAIKFGGPVNIIREGENGFLVDPGDSKNFSKEILRIIGDLDLWKRISRNALHTIKSRYLWIAVVDEYLNRIESK